MSISSQVFAEPHPLLHRIEALQKGELDLNGIALLCQDLIEAREIHLWGPNIYRLVEHHVNQHLCTLTGAYTTVGATQ